MEKVGDGKKRTYFSFKKVMNYTDIEIRHIDTKREKQWWNEFGNWD